MSVTVDLAVIQCSSVSKESAEKYKHWLSPQELERNARYRFERDRHRDVLARSLIRNVLGNKLGIAPSDIEFSTGEHGKPEINLPQHTPIHFNLSHAEDWIVLAVSSAPVGVDVEYTQRKNDVMAIADRYFFGDEYRQLLSFEVSQQTERFFDYWTLKEAFMKARGEGISLGLSNFGFELSDTINLQLTDKISDNSDDWWFSCDTPIDDYRLSLAVKSKAAPALTVAQYETAVDATDCRWVLKN